MAHFEMPQYKKRISQNTINLDLVKNKEIDVWIWGCGDDLDTISTKPDVVEIVKQERLPSNYRKLRLRAKMESPRPLPQIQVVFEKKHIWDWINVSVTKTSGSWIVTRDRLKDANGVVQAKYPPSPAIVALIELLRNGTNGQLRAGVGSLESVGRSGNLYEHTAGLALDIYRNSGDGGQRLQAHNLIRFFIDQRESFGWRNMFYESWGFTGSGRAGGSPNHHNHIHIDWMDFSLLKYDGTNKFDRSNWTEITWPPEARVGTAINTPANVDLVRAAWGNTSSSLLTDGDIAGLYR